jgi:hypothetical protein
LNLHIKDVKKLFKRVRRNENDTTNMIKSLVKIKELEEYFNKVYHKEKVKWRVRTKKINREYNTLTENDILTVIKKNA